VRSLRNRERSESGDEKDPKASGRSHSGTADSRSKPTEASRMSPSDMSCRPPSQGVSRHASGISSASGTGVILPPRHKYVFTGPYPSLKLPATLSESLKLRCFHRSQSENEAFDLLGLSEIIWMSTPPTVRRRHNCRRSEVFSDPFLLRRQSPQILARPPRKQPVWHSPRLRG
jgi:hypothetical protein